MYQTKTYNKGSWTQALCIWQFGIFSIAPSSGSKDNSHFTWCPLGDVQRMYRHLRYKVIRIDVQQDLRYSLWNRKWMVLPHRERKKLLKITCWSLGGDDRLKSLLQVIGSQGKDLITAVMCSVFLVLLSTLVAVFWMSWSCLIREKSITVVKSAGDEVWMSLHKLSLDIRSETLHICLRW